MELSREQITTELVKFKRRILDNGKLAENVLGREMEAILNALALIDELTEENEAWQKQLISHEEKADKAYYDLACEVEDLRAENANLHASCTELTRKCANLNEENERLKNICESYMLQYGTAVDKNVLIKPLGINLKGKIE